MRAQLDAERRQEGAARSHAQDAMAEARQQLKRADKELRQLQVRPSGGPLWRCSAALHVGRPSCRCCSACSCHHASISEDARCCAAFCPRRDLHVLWLEDSNLPLSCSGLQGGLHTVWGAAITSWCLSVAQSSQAALQTGREEAAGRRAAATTARAKAEADIADLEEQLGKHERLQARIVIKGFRRWPACQSLTPAPRLPALMAEAPRGWQVCGARI